MVLIELTAVPSSSSLSLTMHHDKNFAALFPVFDVIFGTAYRPQAHE
jgi:sterol desaturase/sphingolipid hydroxylase (fatty acid hydroxylase superfamily)